MFVQTRGSRLVQLFTVAVLAVALLGGTTLAGPWKGKEVTREGVVHVENPATGQDKPVTIEAEELWRIGGEDDEEIFGVITDVVADKDGNFYMLDSQLSEIKVYDPDGEYLRTIGREGEGPGEFRSGFDLFMVPGGNLGVLQVFPGKVVTLTPDGEPAGDFPLPETDGGFRVLFAAEYAGDNLALIYALNQPSEAGFTQSNVLALVNKAGDKETRLVSADSTMQAATALISEKEWDTFRNGRWAAGQNGKVYVAADFGEYNINVWNSSGQLERVIHREYPAHTRSEEDKQKLLDIYKGFTKRIPIPNIKYEIEDTYNQVNRIIARDDGTIWVRTSRGVFGLEDGVLGTWDVFDDKGRFVRQVTIEGEGDPEQDGYFFVGDRLFVVTGWLDALMALQGGGGSVDDAEDEDEEDMLMEVISYRISLE